MSMRDGYILVCRGADDQLRALEEMLGEAGYRVRAVETGHEAVNRVAAREPDLVVLDDSIEETTPIHIVKQLHHRPSARYVPIVVLASQEQGDEAAAAIKAGAADFVRKPYNLDELLARIDGLVARGRLIRDAKKEADSRSVVLEVVHDVTASLSSEEIFQILVRRVSRLFEIRRCSMILINAGRDSGTVVAAHDDPTISSLKLDLSRYPEIRQAVETGAPVLVKNLKGSALFEQIRPLWEAENIDIDIQSIITVPFSFDEGRAGVFFLRSHPDEPILDEAAVKIASDIVQGTVQALDRAATFESILSHQEQLEILAKTDELTGCLSRRFLMERLENELERAARYQRLLGLVMFDIDDFKNLNDTHGHTTGDAALRAVGEVLRRSLRTADFVGRYGGDEFVLVLPETSAAGTHRLAERIRNGMSRREWTLRDTRMHLTVSGGVVGFPDKGTVTPEDLIDRADQALYEAKAAGRNKVLCRNGDGKMVGAEALLEIEGD